MGDLQTYNLPVQLYIKGDLCEGNRPHLEDETCIELDEGCACTEDHICVYHAERQADEVDSGKYIFV